MKRNNKHEKTQMLQSTILFALSFADGILGFLDFLLLSTFFFTHTHTHTLTCCDTVHCSHATKPL